MSKTKNKMVALIITSSFPMMLFFQNCGQQGALQVTSNGLASNSSMEAATDIPQDPVVDDTLPNSGSDGGMVIVPPPSMPPVVDQPVVDQPATSTPPVVVAPPTAPPVQPPTAGGSPDQQAPQNPNIPTIPTHTPGITTGTDCRNIQIADIRLSIAGVGGDEHTCGGRNRSSGRSDNSPDFELVDANASVSLSNPKIRIRALKNVELKQIFIRLNDSGNQVLSMNNVAMDLVTPSAQESGLKLHLEKSVKLQMDRVYELQLDIRAEDQIVANANKCIFKPVIKSVRIESEKDSTQQSHDNEGHKCDHGNDQHH